MSKVFQQKAGAVRSLLFDFSDALDAGESITSQSASAAVHDGYGDTGSVGSISSIARNADNTEVSLLYTNNAKGLYDITVTATATNQTIAQSVTIEIV